MCGIVGIVGTTEVAAALYDGLTVLQQRGHDAAGIATANGIQLRVHKGNGLVRDVFDNRAMALLEGRVGIGHCRYPTAGSEGLRSDEHTSELQSLMRISYAVFCLKKTQTKRKQT